MTPFRLGLAARLRRYWPVGLVIAVATGFVALTMMASSVASNSLLGPIDSQPPDFILEPHYGEEPQTLPDSLISQLADHPQVAWVEASTSGRVWTEDGPLRIATTAADESHRHWQVLDGGRLPSGPKEVAISQEFRRVSGVDLGDQLGIIGFEQGQSQQFLSVVGLLGPTRSIGGWSELKLAVIDPSESQSLLGIGPNQTQGLLVKLKPDINRDRFHQDFLGQLDLPEGYDFDPIPNQVIDGIIGITVFVGVFVFLSVLVAVFVIVNIFRIILGSQIRDLATLRLLGATRSQICSRLLAESILAAILAGVLAVGLVWGLLVLGLPLVNRFWDLELLGPTLTIWMILAPLLVGVLAGLAGALIPTIVASRRPPVAALGQSVETSTGKKALARTIIGGSLTGLSLVMLLVVPKLGFSPGWANLAYGLGAAGFLAGLAVFSAGLARPFGQALAWLGRPLSNPIWRLGAGNIGRQPSRSSSVANSLLVGISLITIVTILASSFQVSSQNLLDSYFPTDWLITEKTDNDPLAEFGRNTKYQQEQINPKLAGQLLESDLLDNPSAVRYGDNIGQIVDSSKRPEDRERVSVAGYDPGTIDENFNYNVEPSSAGDILASGQVLVDIGFVSLGFGVGQTLEIYYPESDYQAQYVVGGTFNDGDSGLIISNDQYLTAVGKPGFSFIVADSQPGLSDDQTRAGLEELLEDHPHLAVYDLRTEIKEIIDSYIRTGLNVFRGLLGLSLVVAVLGIFSTLILSVRERRREIGALRAIGLTRSQTVSLVVFEGVSMALFGAALGILAGLLAGFAIIQMMRVDQTLAEFLVFSRPWLTLGGYALIAAALGALAALIPALLVVRQSVVDQLGSD